MDIVFASGNLGKLDELNALFCDLNVNLIPQFSLGISEVEEIHSTFVENALLKARNACMHSDLPSIADDSGLMVDVLHGDPGIKTARYASDKATYKENIEKLLDVMKNVPLIERTARFYCVLVYMRNFRDPAPIVCDGVWEGSIMFAPTGKDGFGYDPVFFVPEFNCSASELPFEIKNKMSHRGKALNKLLKVL